MNKKYHIYHFFIYDPEGRKIEFQYFDHAIDRHLAGDDLLRARRSVRTFTDDIPPDDLLDKVFELSRFAPTAVNTQGYYFKIIRDRATLNKLSDVRGSNSKPIGNAPLAVAIASDPALTKRIEQDGCIAAYHFLLAAWFHGLGTCWIADLNRDDVKAMLDIPKEHYIATITPLGFPDKLYHKMPERKERSWFIRK